MPKKKLSKKKRSAISRNNRAKGHGFERDCAAVFRIAFPHLDTIKRTVQSTGGGQEGSDFRFPGMWPECQLSKSPTPIEKLLQAESDMLEKGEHKLPVAIVRKLAGRTAYAYLRTKWWLWLLGPEHARAPGLGVEASALGEVVISMELSDFVKACVAAKLDVRAGATPR